MGNGQILYYIDSPSFKTLWRFVKVYPEKGEPIYYIEKQTRDAIGGEAWIPEANFVESVAESNGLAALVLFFTRAGGHVSPVTKKAPQASNQPEF